MRHSWLLTLVYDIYDEFHTDWTDDSYFLIQPTRNIIIANSKKPFCSAFSYGRQTSFLHSLSLSRYIFEVPFLCLTHCLHLVSFPPASYLPLNPSSLPCIDSLYSLCVY